MAPFQRLRFLFLLASAAVFPLAAARADSVTITPRKDTTIYGNGDASLSNGAGASLFVGRSGPGRALRTLIAFDLAGKVPAGATINSVALTLALNTPHPNSLTLLVHRVTADWGEGTASAGSGGGGGAPATNGSATWNARVLGSANWTTPGGDFATTASASQAASTSAGSVTISSSGLVSDVQAWLANSSTNFGWLIKASDESAPAVRFASRESAPAPSLVISYTSAGSPPAFTSVNSATFVAGQFNSFTVTASGTPAPTLALTSGALPAGVTFSSGVLSGTPTSANGSPFIFTVVASNGVPPDATQTFTLQVIPPPSVPAFTAQPQAQSANVGANATFSVTATGNPTPNFQWQQQVAGTSDFAQLSDGGVFSGTSTATLVLTGVTAAMNGSLFRCVAANGNGIAISNTATLTVLSPPVITTHPQTQSVSEGSALTLAVGVSGTAPFTYQWRKGGSAISGATNSSFTIAVAPADAGSYTVVVTNALGSATSNAAVITVIPAGNSAAHAVSGPGYQAGSTVTITNTLAYAGTASALGWQVLLPAGWSFASDSGSAGDTKPSAGTTDLLEWAWTTIPASPITFTYTLNIPAGQTGDKTLAALAIVRISGAGSAYQLLAKPDPLVVSQVTTHSADTDRNFRISLLELTRVIELYNTRSGTSRTGRYHVADPSEGSEDGFAPGPPPPGHEPPPYHSADSNHDARISLLELTRVIELYNTRSGTTRTGQYHVQTNPPTEDGFAPGS